MGGSTPGGGAHPEQTLRQDPHGVPQLMLATMIFFPEKHFYEMPMDYGLEFEEVQLITKDSTKLHGWYLPAKAEKGALLFFHGNAGNISGRLFKAKGWIDRGYSVFLLDYRSYGKSEGKIQHGEDILEDAQAALDWLTQTRKIELSQMILYGESLGTHPAIRLNVQNKTKALILEAPFTSFLDLARIHYPFVTKGIMKDFTFPNMEYINEIKSPLLILHGTLDEICPYPMAEELIKKAPEPKELFTVMGGAHNDLPVIAGDDYWERSRCFIENL